MLLSSHARSVVHSFKICQQDVINHFCTQYTIFMCSFEYCHLLELYVKCAALYRTFIPHSFIRGNNSNGPIAGCVWEMVVGQGPHKQKTLRHTKHGRIRGSTVLSVQYSCVDLLIICCLRTVAARFVFMDVICICYLSSTTSRKAATLSALWEWAMLTATLSTSPM